MRISFTFLLIVSFFNVKSQLLSWSPPFIQETSDPVELIVDASKGNQGLKDYTPTSDVYVHTGVITSFSTSSTDWKHVKFGDFNAPSPTVQTAYIGNNKWKFTITGGLRAFYGVTDPAEKIQKIAILFRNGNGSRKQSNSDGSDMYIPVYETGLHVRLDEPFEEPRFTPTAETINKTMGDNISINAKSSINATLTLFLNGTQVGATANNTTTISATATISSYGTQTIIAHASAGADTKSDTITFFVTPPTPVAPLPAGFKDGINYGVGADSVTLVLFAPGKTRVAVLGDFNNWTETESHQMNRTPDGQRYWLAVKGLTPGVEYGYQYLIDGNLKVADYMAEKVLDPANDPFIPAANYPGLKPYPTGKTTGIVSIFQTNKPVYNWQVKNFSRPDKRNLIIYEMLVRDFVATQNWQTVQDSISYLKKLGVNAIELMPFNEFEGNNSWGYNPTFFFAPDKMYGTETALRRFIDECHKQGIAVIMDIVMNHSTGLAPTAQMYWNSTLNRPAANSPWYNEAQNHPFNFGPEFNHESQATKDLVDNVVDHWLTKYKIDGFRWDLSKGFTQTNTCTTNNCGTEAEISNWSNYDASRVAIWKRIYDSMQVTVPGSYCIMEHLAVNQEEKELSDYGMLLWGNMNYNYNEATMGYLANSNFQYGIYTNRTWSKPHLVTYQESHDEERLMFKNVAYGNAAGGYNVRDTNTALARNGMAAAFWAVTPAPKMLWQFGELGYGYSINTCEDGTINNNCRVSPKPIRWDYLNNPNRVALYNVYARIFKLRNIPNFLPTFVTSDVSYNLNGAFKWLKVNSDSLKILVIGNFDVTTTTGSVSFQNAGTWYNYLAGGTKTATGGVENFTLQPGEYYVYVNRNVDSIAGVLLPLKLLGFNGKRGTNKISLAWSTTKETNVKAFIPERSFNGNDFDAIATVAAKNSTATQADYTYADFDPLAIQSKESIYYRLKMLDVDGKYTYSGIAVINPLAGNTKFAIYPNPVKGSTIYVDVNETSNSKINIKIEDMSGRLYKRYSITRNNLNGNIPVNVSALPKGAYVLKVETAGQAIVKQFIVQK